MKKPLLYSLAMGLLFCACSQDAIECEKAVETTKVNLRIATDSWSGTETCAGELLTPVTLLLVPDGGSTVVKRKVVEGDDFSIEVPNGSYDIFAVCGLPSDNIPDNIFGAITIPLSASESGYADFAVGAASVANEYGKISPSTVNITAKRQMAWLTVKITNVPETFSEPALRVKGLGETYNIAAGWSTTDEGKSKFTEFTLLSKPWQKSFSMDAVVIPCTNKTSGTEFKIEAKTTDSKTLTYKYTSTTPLSVGTHLTLNLSISDLALVSESITTEDWNTNTESGTLNNPTVE